MYTTNTFLAGTIYDEYRRKMPLAPSQISQVGDNLFVLELGERAGFKEGDLYTLEVSDAKSNPFVLKFKYHRN